MESNSDSPAVGNGTVVDLRFDDSFKANSLFLFAFGNGLSICLCKACALSWRRTGAMP
jgi:hypothetical protein